MLDNLRIFGVYETTKDNYYWEFFNTQRNQFCTYTLSKLTQSSICLICTTRRCTVGKTKCIAKLNLKPNANIIEFIEHEQSEKGNDVYKFRGGKEVITNTENYKSTLHTHTRRCGLVTNGWCRITRHESTCWTDESIGIARTVRAEVKRVAAEPSQSDATSGEILNRAMANLHDLPIAEGLVLGEAPTLLPDNGVINRNEQKAIWRIKGQIDPPDDVPKSKQNIIMPKSMTKTSIETQMFYHSFDDMDIFTTATDLAM